MTPDELQECHRMLSTLDNIEESLGWLAEGRLDLHFNYCLFIFDDQSLKDRIGAAVGAELRAHSSKLRARLTALGVDLSMHTGGDDA